MHVVRTNQPAEMVGEPGGIRRHESSVCIVDLCVGRVRTRSMPSLWTRVMMTPELRKTGDGASHAPFQVDWWELFFDLIFIGVAIGLDDAVVVTLSDPQPISVAFTILVSFVFTLLWFDFTLYFNRFETKGDVYTTNSLFLYALSIVLMSVSIGHIHNGLGLRFCLFASMSCVSMALVYVPICLRGGPGERQFARMRIMLLAVDCALWILAGSLWGFPQIQVAVVAIIIIKVFSVEFVFTGDSFRLSRNPIHLSDRHYTLVLVFLGEILAKLIRTRPSTMSPAQLGALVLSFQICFTVKQLCHDCAPRSHDEMALSMSLARGIAFTCAHLLLPVALLALSNGLQRIMEQASRTTTPTSTVYLVTISYVVVLAIFKCMRRLHPFQHRSAAVWATRISIIAIMTATLLVTGHRLPPLVVAGTIAAVGFGLALFDRLGFDLPSHRRRPNADCTPVAI